MIPAAFGYHRAASIAEALDLLAQGARVLAGGQSLLPALKARTTHADLLVDIGHLADLDYIRDCGDYLAIGAATRHHRLATDPLASARLPVLAAAAAEIADPQVRHAGTIGGSLAHADPAADLTLAGVALGASVVLAQAGGERVVALDGFATGRHTTVCQPDEMVVEVRVPAVAGVMRWSYQKFHRDALEWAVVGVVALAGGAQAAVALSGMGPTVTRAHAVEAALAAGAGAAAAAGRAAEGTAPVDDLSASVTYRRHLAAVLTRRALTQIGVPL
ncbi:MAG TPA: FAD binding domain-containing protein [Streptosporangiaceae bacterium]|nr:FAD binding domain-containing protein [Streptosporangiaceae bacterium]